MARPTNQFPWEEVVRLAPRLDVAAFLDALRADPSYSGQIVHVRQFAAQAARMAEPRQPFHACALRFLEAQGVAGLYSHQAQALDLVRAGHNVVLATGTASGKSLAYLIPIIETLSISPATASMLLFPTKALAQDQCRAFLGGLDAAELPAPVAGVYDGDTPPDLRRKLRNSARVLFTNPDMLHAGILPQHARWGHFLQQLRWLVIDELHTYGGMFGSNVANLMRRFFRVCARYGSSPQIIACSATMGNPRELAEHLTGEPFELVDDDGSPHGSRTFVFWNPPQERHRRWRSRRSANVEAHELMARLVRQGVPTITFSKAKMTAEMIRRYVCERLAADAPGLADKITTYRGGYLPEERREIERRLFAGELLGVSTTPALELGIDIGGLDASIIVGYPGTLSSFYQQAGRAGRRDRDSLVILVGLDTAVNQYVMAHPEFIFDRPVERTVVDPDNPFVLLGQLRCAAHESPIDAAELSEFGPYAGVVLRVLEGNSKLRRRGDRWYHASSEIPQHEVSLRDCADRNILIQDIETQETIGELNQFDAPPIVHPEAIYMHRGDTYYVESLDMVRNRALVRKVEVDYYTQPLGGTDVHHIDHILRERPFGAGRACWGEVTAHFQNVGYERIRFYTLDAISRHPLDLPHYLLETMAFWIEAPEHLVRTVAQMGLNPHTGLRGIGYATRMLLPMFMTCQTLDFSHTVGSANSPWHTVFIYERYPLGLGFTEKAYEMLGTLMPAVRDHVRQCPCVDGCPSCVGKPLRQFTTWNVERGEASIPSKAASLAMLDGILGDGSRLELPETRTLAGIHASEEVRIETLLRRRLERMRESETEHPVVPGEELASAEPAPQPRERLEKSDVSARIAEMKAFTHELRKRARERQHRSQGEKGSG